MTTRDLLDNFENYRASQDLAHRDAVSLLVARVVSDRRATVSRVGEQFSADPSTSQTSVPNLNSTATEWHEYYEYLLENLPAFFDGPRDAQKDVLDLKWRNIESGLKVSVLADAIMDNTSQVRKLGFDRPVAERRLMFYDKLNSDIKMMMVQTFAESSILETDTELVQLQKYSNLVNTALRIESIKDKNDGNTTNSDDSRKSKRRQSHATTSTVNGSGKSQNGNSRNSRSGDNRRHLEEQFQLCYSWARNGQCQLGQRCKRLHQSAKEYMASSHFKKLGPIAQKNIKSIAAAFEGGVNSITTSATPTSSSSTPSSSKSTNSDGASTVQELIRLLRPQSTATTSSTIDLGSTGLVSADSPSQLSQAQIIALLAQLVTPSSTTTPRSSTLTADVPAPREIAAPGEISLNDLLIALNSQSLRSGTPTATTAAAAAADGQRSNSDGNVVPPRSRVTVSAQFAAYLGYSSSSKIRVKVDTGNESPRSIISKAVYDQLLRPQGYFMKPVPNGDYAFSACNGQPLNPIGVLDVPIFFDKPGVGAVAPFILSVYVMDEKSGFSEDLLFNVKDLQDLNVQIDLGAKTIQFKALDARWRNNKYRLHDGMSTFTAISKSNPTSNLIQALTTAAGTFNLGRGKVIRPNSEGVVSSSVVNMDKDYFFTTAEDSPVSSGVIGKDTSRLKLHYKNESPSEVRLPAHLKVQMTAPHDAVVRLNSISTQTGPTTASASSQTPTPSTSELTTQTTPLPVGRASTTSASSQTSAPRRRTKKRRASIVGRVAPNENHVSIFRSVGAILLYGAAAATGTLAGYAASGQFSASTSGVSSLVAPDIGTSPVNVSENDVDALNRYFREQQELLSHDFPEEEMTPENPSSLKPDDSSWYFGDLKDIQIDDSLSEDRQAQIRKLCDEYSDIFIRPSKELPRTDRATHYIDTGDARPIKKRLRKYTPEEQATERRELENMLAEGVIEPGDGPWASTPVMVKKPDGSIRYCVNYVPLNRVTKKNAYPLPDQSEQLRRLANCRFKFKLDAWAGYWQVPIAPEDRDKAAFITSLGLFRPISMMFGLVNAGPTFQAHMDDSFSEEIRDDVMRVYVDDISGGRNDFSQFLKDLRRVFNRCRLSKILLKPKKCYLGFNRVKHLGRIIEGSSISMDPESVQSVKDFPEPRTKKEVFSFLGLSGWCRDFVRNFAKEAFELTQMLKKAAPERFDSLTTAQRTAFSRLKSLITTSPALRQPDMSKPFQIEVDASKMGFGAVLLQEESDGQLAPCGYFSRSTTALERRWAHPNKLEARGLVWAVNRLSQYLRSRPFTIRTDARNLLWLLNGNYQTGLYARWVMALSEYDFVIKHCSVPAADALSRAPGFESLVGSSTAPLNTVNDTRVSILIADYDATVSSPVAVDLSLAENKSLELTLEAVVAAQQDDPFCLPIIGAIRDGAPGFEHFFLDGTCLRTSFRDFTGDYNPVVLPFNFRELAIRAIHDSPMTGHLGARKTIGILRRQFYWPRMRKDILDYVFSCETCQLSKQRTLNRRAGSLHPLPYDRLMKIISADYVGPIAPVSARGNRYILVVMDNFSNLIWLVPTPDETAKTTAEALLKIFLANGFPDSFLSDRGSNFLSSTVSELLKLLKIHQVATSAYHPATDGKNEVSHRLLLAQIRSFLAQTGTENWDLLLDSFAFAVNSAPLYDSDLSPFFLFFGRQPRSPNDVAFSFDARALESDNSTQIRTAVAEETRDRLRTAHEFLKAYRERRDVALKARREEYSRPLRFGVGDFVICHSPQYAKGISHKLINQFIGPFEVIAEHRLSDGTLAPNSYDLRHVRTGREMSAVNVERLHRFRPGSDFLLRDFNPQQPVSSPSAPSSAPEILIDDFVLGDMVAVRRPDDEKRFVFAQVTHVDDYEGQLSVQYWGTHSKNLATAAFLPEYVDPKDNKSVFTLRPAPRYLPATSIFSLGDVLCKPFNLNAKRQLPRGILSSLQDQGLVGSILIRQ